MPGSLIQVEIVTAERMVYSDNVEMVIVPGVEGEMGILHNHAPLLTALKAGELRTLKEGQELEALAVTGGFLEVQPDSVIVLADAAERADEIDEARAEEARKRAEARLRGDRSAVDLVRAEAALRRSLVRLKLAKRRKQK
jgi:F-type H+-transporting ATPase subunit epsilon